MSGTVAAPYDIAGVVHVHSLYSDGTGTVPEVAAAAEANGLDFVLLTDHDTLEAKRRGEEGWHGPVLVLVGEEVSPRRENHYLAFGLEEPIDHAGLAPAEIVERVNQAGGFGFLSHPFSRGSERFRRGIGGMPWRDLECVGYTGLELWSFLTDSAEGLRGVADVLRFILTPGRFLRQPPRANLEAWDRLCAARRCVAIGGVDAHQIGIRIGDRVPFRLMAYRRSFRYLHTHLLAAKPLTGDLESDRDVVYEALIAGRAYISIDAQANAHGFRFWADAGDGQKLAMGDEAPTGDDAWVLNARVPQPADIRLLRDGRVVALAHGTVLEHRAEGQGVYRIEAYIDDRGGERAWILSNPIYLR